MLKRLCSILLLFISTLAILVVARILYVVPVHQFDMVWRPLAKIASNYAFPDENLIKNIIYIVLVTFASDYANSNNP